ncbi:MAG: hypothetical protein E7773_00825 [Sphingomonas sp.]|uniref:DUF6445 family protein n=1 Tax=Sphingomonas sp. TaxID=28214 RepID=UPI00121E2163|nr:DUF6445 family protein [Sphingomonas sp.]THD38327.1 MAG: hypothetical protein E7773_00825 [Sphingomonas sp.]
MTPALHHIGAARQPVIVIDDFTGAPQVAVSLAAATAPFPRAAGNYYPGLRQPIVAGDAAFDYIERLLQDAAPFIGGGFDVGGFELIEASFSMVTAAPDALDPAQRAPHFDSIDPDQVAVMHYLSETPGTAFYRQRATGIETVDAGNVARFVAAATAAADTMAGYTNESNAHYEQIGAVAGHIDRLAIYRGAMLHSGIIPPDAVLSDDPRTGRLTTNIFLRLRP